MPPPRTHKNALDRSTMAASVQARFRQFGRGSTDTREARGVSITLGCNPDCELRFDRAAYPQVSGEHARIEYAGRDFVLIHLSRSNKTLLNDKPVEDRAAIKPGDRIRLGQTGPVLEIVSLLLGGTQNTKSAPPPVPEPAHDTDTNDTGVTIQAQAPQLAMIRGSARAAADRFELGNGGVLGRDGVKANFRLEHPLVSRRHARIVKAKDRYTIQDFGTANGTFVNGERIARPTELLPGDRVDIGPFALEFDGTGLVSQSRTNNIELVARNVSRTVTDRGTGQPLKLLDGVNLVVKPREFVALLGPSGSGKTTLLGLLSGRGTPDDGDVLVNGRDLSANFSSLKHDIAVVPQRDALHETLTVEEALRYTAQLRLPRDTDHEELNNSVKDILDAVSLTARRTTVIRNLSGGQLKRTSLANEILSKPTLLFLDEVTSGLDEQTDRDMMELFRLIAEGGKTVVCITHNLANVEDCCHLVVILTAGGKLAFVGTPDEAKAHFQVTRLGDVYRTLATKDAGEWQRLFAATPLYRKYVEDRLPLRATRAGEKPKPATIKSESSALLGQAQILTRRTVALWKADRMALAALIAQCVMVAFLLVMVFGSLDEEKIPDVRKLKTGNLVFMMAVTAYWLGCNTAAKELVKERIIFERERAFNLRPISYYCAKFLVLAAVTLAQISLLFVIVRIGSQPAGNIVWQWATLALLAIAGTAMGLFISVLARTEEVATALVPIVVIPQIILSGGLASLTGAMLSLAKTIISCYWGRDALVRLNDNAPAGVNAKTEDISLNFVAIGLHAIVFALAALVLLHRRRSQ